MCLPLPCDLRERAKRFYPDLGIEQVMVLLTQTGLRIFKKFSKEGQREFWRLLEPLNRGELRLCKPIEEFERAQTYWPYFTPHQIVAVWFMVAAAELAHYDQADWLTLEWGWAKKYCRGCQERVDEQSLQVRL